MSQAVRVARRENFAGPPITINVGQNNIKSLIVHEPILRKSSKFFDTLLSKDWKETTTRTIDLPEDDPLIVGIYVDWLYTGEIATAPAEALDLPDDEIGSSERTTLAALYCFGEKIQDNKFCNATMRCIIELIDAPINGKRYFHSPAMICDLYRGTHDGSPARRFIVQLFVDYGDASWVDDDQKYAML